MDNEARSLAAWCGHEASQVAADEPLPPADLLEWLTGLPPWGPAPIKRAAVAAVRAALEANAEALADDRRALEALERAERKLHASQSEGRRSIEETLDDSLRHARAVMAAEALAAEALAAGDRVRGAVASGAAYAATLANVYFPDRVRPVSRAPQPPRSEALIMALRDIAGGEFTHRYTCELIDVELLDSLRPGQIRGFLQFSDLCFGDAVVDEAAFLAIVDELAPPAEPEPKLEPDLDALVAELHAVAGGPFMHARTGEAIDVELLITIDPFQWRTFLSYADMDFAGRTVDEERYFAVVERHTPSEPDDGYEGHEPCHEDYDFDELLDPAAQAVFAAVAATSNEVVTTAVRAALAAWALGEDPLSEIVAEHATPD